MELLKQFKTYFTGLLILLMPLGAWGQQNISNIIDAFQQSYINEGTGKYPDAIEVLKNIYNEDSYEINLRLGWLTYQSGLFSESLAFYNKAIALMPYSIEPRWGVVLPASALGNWEMVINQYQKILEINPNNSIAHHRLGLIYYGRDEFQEAYKHFEKVVNLYPFDYDGLTMLAWTNFKLGKQREAIVLFRKALMHTPSGSSALEGLELLEK
jgi:tetratricopeptide (TPR) repeat protein